MIDTSLLPVQTFWYNPMFSQALQEMKISYATHDILNHPHGHALFMGALDIWTRQRKSPEGSILPIIFEYMEYLALMELSQLHEPAWEGDNCDANHLEVILWNVQTIISSNLFSLLLDKGWQPDKLIERWYNVRALQFTLLNNLAADGNLVVEAKTLHGMIANACYWQMCEKGWSARNKQPLQKLIFKSFCSYQYDAHFSLRLFSALDPHWSGELLWDSTYQRPYTSAYPCLKEYWSACARPSAVQWFNYRHPLLAQESLMINRLNAGVHVCSAYTLLQKSWTIEVQGLSEHNSNSLLEVPYEMSVLVL